MSTYVVSNPATGEKSAPFAQVTDAEVAKAIEQAHATHLTWSKSTTVAQRAALIERVAELHRERREELAAIIVREMGKPLAQARGEVDFTADIYSFYATNGERFLADEPIAEFEGDGEAFIRRSSLGVLLGIMPWNFPYYQVARFAGPNLVLGNTILLKHASQCPESAGAMHKIFHDAGFPAGAYTNLYAAQQADRHDHRRPACAGSLVDRLGARRRCRCGAGRSSPQEGRTRARWFGSLHSVEHRRHGLRR